MANLNKVFLMGNLTRDPELRYTPSGTAVCEFSMAINRKWKSKDGADADETVFVDVTAWEKQADVIGKYLHKGDPVLVEGRLKLDRWEGKDGQKRNKISVVLEQFQFIGGKGEPVASKPEATPAQKPVKDFTPNVPDDDIPF